MPDKIPQISVHSCVEDPIPGRISVGQPIGGEDDPSDRSVVGKVVEESNGCCQIRDDVLVGKELDDTERKPADSMEETDSDDG